MPAAATRLTAGAIAAQLSLELDGDSDTPVSGINSLADANAEDAVFVADPKYLPQLADTRAGTAILSPAHREQFAGTALLSDNPYLAYARLSQLLYPLSTPAAGVHETALIDASAHVDPTASIGPYVVVAANARIAAGCVVGAHCVLGESVTLGAHTRLHARVVIHDRVALGSQCTVHSGAVIGSDGFGFAPDAAKRWHKIQQIGSVRIGDRVEIGANTTIDCGAIDDTVIADGVILDNQIQIGHNVHIGENAALAGCTGVAGSTHIGARVQVGGHSALLGHLQIADDVILMGHSVVSGSLRSAGVYASVMPVMPVRVWRRLVARFRQLDRRA